MARSRGVVCVRMFMRKAGKIWHNSELCTTTFNVGNPRQQTLNQRVAGSSPATPTTPQGGRPERCCFPRRKTGFPGSPPVPSRLELRDRAGGEAALVSVARVVRRHLPGAVAEGPAPAPSSECSRTAGVGPEIPLLNLLMPVSAAGRGDGLAAGRAGAGFVEILHLHQLVPERAGNLQAHGPIAVHLQC